MKLRPWIYKDAFVHGEFMEKNSNYKPVYAEEDCDVYCGICNKTVRIKKGEEIPLCCGKLMEVLD